MVTFGFVALFTFHQPTKDFARHNPALFWVALAVLLVTMIAMACCEGVRRKTPMNFIFLGLFTLAESFLLGMTAGNYAANEVSYIKKYVHIVRFSRKISSKNRYALLD